MAHKSQDKPKGRKVFILMEKDEWLVTLANRGLASRGLAYSGRMEIRPMITHRPDADGDLIPQEIRLEIDLTDWDKQKHRNKG